MNTLFKTQYNQQTEYETRDGSMIRELMHPTVNGALGIKQQSQGLSHA